jgi:uncharacterized membrane protein
MRLIRFVPLLVLVALCAAAALVPKAWLWPLDLAGYAVCHRITQRSFVIDNAQLPVCARDTGMFGAALLGVLVLALYRPTRATGFARKNLAWVFVLFFVAWGFDGVNSYLVLLRGEPLLYPPRNWLRLATGAFMGIALAAHVVPLFNQAVWAQPNPAENDQPVLRGWRDVAGLVLVALGVIGAVLWRPNFLYGPIALVSALGIVVLLSTVNGLLFVLATKRSGRVTAWRQLLLPGLVGLALTLLEIGIIDWLRWTLTRDLVLPIG